MKPTEVMIGDWVRCQRPFKQTPFIIKSIQFDSEYEEYYVTYNDTDAFVRNLEPVPLTKEILEKNEFEKHYDGDIAIMINGDAAIEIGINFKEGFRKGGMFLRGINKRLFYVHELQHALRLFGLNELADNFKLEKGNNQ